MPGLSAARRRNLRRRRLRYSRGCASIRTIRGEAMGTALARAISVALLLVAIRWWYARQREREGLGLGDVKLSAAVGAWLPIEFIPWCFGLAAGSALIAVMFARLRGESIDATMKIPFGAFLCPALWLVFYASVLPT